MSKVIKFKKATKKAATVNFNYNQGRMVEFKLDDVRSACKKLGIAYRSNMASAKKKTVYDWLVEHEIAPYMAIHEDGAECYGDAAISVLYNKMAPLSEKELAEIAWKVRTSKDTSDEAEPSRMNFTHAMRLVIGACSTLVNDCAYTPEAAMSLSFDEVKAITGGASFTAEDWAKYSRVFAIFAQYQPETDNVSAQEALRVSVCDAINTGKSFDEVDAIAKAYYDAHPFRVEGTTTIWLPISETPANKVEEPAKVSEAPAINQQVAREIAHLDTVLNEIVRYASLSRYNNITDYRLYSNLKLKAADCRDALNMLYKQGMITVKAIGTYKIITPTSKAYRATTSQRPVSKEACKKVFMAITKYEYENTRYLNVSSTTLERTVARQVGVVTFDNAINKLLQAGYIEAKTIGTMTVYNSTKVGRDRLQSSK